MLFDAQTWRLDLDGISNHNLAVATIDRPRLNRRGESFKCPQSRAAHSLEIGRTRLLLATTRAYAVVVSEAERRLFRRQ